MLIDFYNKFRTKGKTKARSSKAGAPATAVVDTHAVWRRLRNNLQEIHVFTLILYPSNPISKCCLGLSALLIRAKIWALQQCSILEVCWILHCIEVLLRTADFWLMRLGLMHTVLLNCFFFRGEFSRSI